MTAAAQGPPERRVVDALVEGAPLGVALLGPDARVLRVNAALVDLVGCKADELVGSRWPDLVAVEDRADVQALVERLCDDALPRVELAQRWARADGALAFTHVTVTALGAGDGAAAGFVLHVEPVGERGSHGRWRGTGPVAAAAAMQEAGAALGDAVTLDQVTAVMQERVLGAFGADGLLISLVEGPRLRLVAARGYPRAAVVALGDLPLDDPAPMAEVVRRRVPRFFESLEDYVAAHPARAEVAALTAKRAWAFLPLIAGGRTVGSWTLSFEAAHRFPIADRALLIALSGLLAQAVARAQVLDAERSLARALQASLLPTELPVVPHAEIAVRYRPAGAGVAVGGDFYDVAHLPDGGVSLVVGDVQGHSAEAAAVMGQVRAALRAYAADGHDPPAVVARANRFLLTAGIDAFVTCTYGHLDASSGRLRLVRAGHLPPLRVRDRRADLLELPGGLPLGVAADAGYEAVVLDLAAGDRLVLFTDGLVEARGTTLDTGHAALAARAAAAAGRALEGFADAVLAADGPREDDVVVLALDYGGGDAAAAASDRAGLRASGEGRPSA